MLKFLMEILNYVENGEVKNNNCYFVMLSSFSNSHFAELLLGLILLQNVSG